MYIHVHICICIYIYIYIHAYAYNNMHTNLIYIQVWAVDKLRTSMR